MSPISLCLHCDWTPTRGHQIDCPYHETEPDRPDWPNGWICAACGRSNPPWSATCDCARTMRRARR